LLAAPALAGVGITTVTFSGRLDETLTGVSSITVNGRAVTVGPDRGFAAEVEIPTGATQATAEIEVSREGKTYTRRVGLTLEELGPPIEELDVSRAELVAFLGGKGGILTWVDAGTQVRVLDFRAADPQVRLLSDDLDCVNPIVSPDGTRVVYSQGNPGGPKLIRVRNIESGATQSIATGDIGYWYEDGTGDYVIYSDWSDKNANGAGGNTYKQKLVTGGVAKDGGASILHDRAMDAGGNADLSWLGQVYGQMWAYDVAAGTEYSFDDFHLIDGSVADHQTCNGSMAPDTSARMMLLAIPHDWIRIFTFVPADAGFSETSRFLLPARMDEWEFPDWSTSPSTFTAVLRQGGLNLRLYVLEIAPGEVVPEMIPVTPWDTNVTYSHLWVAP
jgi:hypothetical protein